MVVPSPATSADLNVEAGQSPAGTVCWKGTNRVTETAGASPSVIGMCTTDTRDMQATNLTVPAGKTGSLLLIAARFTSIDTDTDTPPADPVKSAIVELQSATAAGGAALWAEHVAAMSARVSPGVEVSGNLDLAQAINASHYAMMCTVRADVLYSSSPGGLATNACETPLAAHVLGTVVKRGTRGSLQMLPAPCSAAPATPTSR
jgi:hypothetical protein